MTLEERYRFCDRPSGSRALSAARRHQAMRDDLAQDAPLNRLVRSGRIGPPPTVLPHRLGGCNKAVADSREVLIRVVEAEDQASGANPAQRQPLGTQIILKHPIVARRLRVPDGPD